MKKIGVISFGLLLASCTSGLNQKVGTVTGTPTPVPVPGATATPDPLSLNASICSSTSSTYYFPLSACQTVSTSCTAAVVVSGGVSYVCYKAGNNSGTGTSTSNATNTSVRNNTNVTTTATHNVVTFGSGSTPTPTPAVFNPWKFGADNDPGTWSSSGVACSGNNDCSYTGQAGVTLTSDNHCLLTKISVPLHPNISGSQNIFNVTGNYFWYSATSGATPCDAGHYNKQAPVGTYGDFLNPNDHSQCIWGIASGATCSNAFVHDMGDGTIGFYCQPQSGAGTQNYGCLPGTTAYLLAPNTFTCKLNSAPANLVAVQSLGLNSDGTTNGDSAFVYTPRTTVPNCNPGDSYTSNGGGWCVYSNIPAGWHGQTIGGIGYVDFHGSGCR